MWIDLPVLNSDGTVERLLLKLDHVISLGISNKNDQQTAILLKDYSCIINAPLHEVVAAFGITDIKKVDGNE